MKVAIFENEYDSVKIAFETANLIYFNNIITFKIFPSSQSAEGVALNKFDVIFIDIDLSSKSVNDGYSLIEYLVETYNLIHKKIVILTGNNKIREALTNRNIDASLFNLIIKPTNFILIGDVIKKITGLPATT
ncbi:response regulator [Flavobacterium kingsejongi]|uniref:Response regulatory domain-containing protein n=1 Tax=Flavobacterium kingsejongi TaxID=1678728 RepID=A0A2S1LRF9_9FLAO|nr:response regulator [Flavobacterium kingsejongi]AWG26309.1 hypothetical protein FK004_14245 [Flavobacterium kingsejongi]